MKVLKNNSGISLIFVLAAMLMLMALGVSALTAAGLNFGVNIEQSHRNQLNLYSSSMNRTIRAAMEATPVVDVPLDDADTFGSQIIAAVFAEFFNATSINGVDEIDWTTPDDFYIFVRSDISGDTSTNLIVKPMLSINTNQFSRSLVPPLPLPAVNATRFHAWVSGEIIIEQTTTFNPAVGSEISLRTRTVYRLRDSAPSGFYVNVSDYDISDSFYTGALLREEIWTYSKVDPPELEDIVIVNSGTWEVVSHEIVN